MEEVKFQITIISEKDFLKISKLLQAEKHKAELLKRKDNSAFVICFESDYGEYELINKIEDEFINYKRVEEISIGKLDIRIHIKRDKIFLNDWDGSMTPMPEENIYFIT